ncbi:death-associated protein kinase dapk-1-like [Amphiura filiformis]|uniref:death-associated protein kinase dapk-1-like n=1 Tax=Amphiura filiformis TaxID=82378 RepID=UPI003B21DE88
MSTTNQETPLHIACKKYDPFDKDSIDMCVLMIECGGDLEVKNKVGHTPIDVLGRNRKTYGLESEHAKPIKKAIQRREYSLLLAEESYPVTIVKVFLVGDPTAGKTSIKNSLTMNTKQMHAYIPTPGIDVGTYEIEDVGTLSIWDAAGHIEYHVTHGMFLGSQNSLVVLVYNLKEPNAYARLQYWLRFLRSGQSDTAKTKLTIAIVATRLDEFDDKEEALQLAKKHLDDVRAYFGKALDIATDLLVVNACDAQSNEMGIFKSTLRNTTMEIKGTRKIPKLCEAILENKASWVKPKNPVLPFLKFIERVKEVDPLASTKLAKIAANYLEDMGELFLAQNGNISHVVLDVQWLAYYIIGPTLAGDIFADQLNVLAPKAAYSKEELEGYYRDVADFSTLSQLLQSLGLMVTFNDINFVIPAKAPKESGISKAKFQKGRSIFCDDDRSMLSPVVFPTIQARIMKAFGSESNQPIVSLGSMQFANETLALVKQYEERDAINFAVEYKDEDAELCYNDLEKMTSIIVSTMYELSPGTSIATGYLSPQSIQQCPTLVSVQYYKMKDIELGEDDDGTVYHKSLEIKEKTSDILVAGGNPQFLRKKGMGCDYQWMLRKPKERLFGLLDSTTCLRTDYRSLAEILNIDHGDLRVIEERCLESNSSRTEFVLNHWRATTGQRMSLKTLHAILKHPGLVGNIEAATTIEDMMYELGQQVTFDITDADTPSSGEC